MRTMVASVLFDFDTELIVSIQLTHDQTRMPCL